MLTARTFLSWLEMTKKSVPLFLGWTSANHLFRPIETFELLSFPSWFAVSVHLWLEDLTMTLSLIRSVKMIQAITLLGSESAA